MDTNKIIEKKCVSEEAQGTDSGSRTEKARLVEMGAVSAETKGFTRGLEIFFTPRG